jgi:putative endonuclease
MSRGGYVYILASKQNGTLYIGVTSNLSERINQHKDHAVQGFTDKYSVGKLVWYENHSTIEEAIQREKQLKNWQRAWKLELIERDNPQWNDLSADLLI